MRILGWMTVLILVGCAKSETSPNHVGETVAALEQSEGKPVAIEAAPSVSTPAASAKPAAPSGAKKAFDFKSTKLHRYSDGRSYQVENEKVVAYHRAPSADEKTLQAWYQKRGASRRESALAQVDEAKGGHVTLGTVRFLDLKRTVVFDRRTGEVVKVIEQ